MEDLNTKNWLPEEFVKPLEPIYTAPNMIGFHAFTMHETRTIRHAERKDLQRQAAIITNGTLMILCIIIALHTYLFEYAVTGAVSFGLSFFGCIFLKPQIKCSAASYGRVVQKDILSQSVVKGSQYRFKRYIAEPVMRSNTEEQDFCYLTLELSNGKLVRYVNCLREDFDALFIGDEVLAVCYGFNDIRGYLIPEGEDNCYQQEPK